MDWLTGGYTAEILGAIKDKRAVPSLLDLLNNESREVRKQIIHSLGELRDPRALPALRELTASRADREMAALAKQAMQA